MADSRFQFLDSNFHAYILEGEKDLIIPELCLSLEKKFGVTARGNPDFVVCEYESFGIDEARAVKEIQSRKNIGLGKQIFVLAFSFISHEAQNSLLKVLEEPRAETFFFMIVAHAGIFLPTVLSRTRRVSFASEVQKEDIPIEAFLSSRSAPRMKMLASTIEDKDKSKAILLTEGLLCAFHKRVEKDTSMSTYDAAILADIEKCRGYLYDRGASVKMILEHLVLTFPRKD